MLCIFCKIGNCIALYVLPDKIAGFMYEWHDLSRPSFALPPMNKSMISAFTASNRSKKQNQVSSVFLSKL